MDFKKSKVAPVGFIPFSVKFVGMVALSPAAASKPRAIDCIGLHQVWCGVESGL